MKNWKIAIICGALFLFAFSTVQSKEWYEGGTLHRATVKQFLNGSPADALATTGDWVARTIGERQQKQITMDDIKAASVDVYQCIRTATAGNKAVQNNKAVEFAAMCAAMLKKDYPWLLTAE